MLVPAGRLVIALALLPLALLDKEKALFVLIALFLMKMTNTAIVSAEPLAATAAWITSLAASTRIWFGFAVHNRHVREYQSKILLFLAIFVFVVLALAAFSLSPMVSVMKGGAFFYIAGAILVATTRTAYGTSTTMLWLHASWISVLAISILTLAIPEVAYFRDGHGFQGALSHPQGLAVFTAPFLAWLIGRALSERKFSSTTAFAIVIVVSILFLTRARTGLASMLLGAALLGLLRTGVVGKWVKWVTRRKLGLLLIPIIIFASPKIYSDWQDKITEYVFKSAATGELGEAFEMSRGFLILQAFENFKDHPVTGIGFGVSSSETHEFNVEVDPVTGVPIGAATEKANLAVAVLEETGFVGSLFFVIFFLVFLRTIANSADVAIAWAALTAVCTNISETTFFSMNGFGTYIWMICGVAIALSPAITSTYQRRTMRKTNAPVDDFG
jgi:hypothetical protein